jgi:PAS domain S-box-containing protein
MTTTDELQQRITQLERELGNERDQRERAEESLQQAENLLRNITKDVPAIVHQVRFDAQQRLYFSYISEGVSKIYEIDAQTVLDDADRLLRLVHPDDAATMAAVTAAAFETNARWTLEYRVLPASGNLRWVRGTAEPNRLPDGTVEWNGVTYDITEEKLAGQKLQESEERYRSLFTNQIDAISIFEVETKQIVDVNDAYLRLYGYRREEIVGQPISIVSAEPEATHRAIDQATARGETLIKERRHRRKDGTELIVEIAAGPFRWRGETLMYAFIRDITARKRAEQAIVEHERSLQEKNAELQRALEEVTQLRGFLPICCQCKKIRDDDGYWNQIEVYIKRHSAADFTHTMCPACAKAFYPDLLGDDYGQHASSRPGRQPDGDDEP